MMEKQIEEISKILTDAAHKACEDNPFAPPNLDSPCIRPNVECHHCKEGRALIYAGYRKQSEVAREIFEEIEEVTASVYNDFMCNRERVGMNATNVVIFSDELDIAIEALKKKYTEVQK